MMLKHITLEPPSDALSVVPVSMPTEQIGEHSQYGSSAVYFLQTIFHLPGCSIAC